MNINHTNLKTIYKSEKLSEFSCNFEPYAHPQVSQHLSLENCLFIQKSGIELSSNPRSRETCNT